MHDDVDEELVLRTTLVVMQPDEPLKTSGDMPIDYKMNERLMPRTDATNSAWP